MNNWAQVFSAVMTLKAANGMANGVNSDLTTSLGAVCSGYARFAQTCQVAILRTFLVYSELQKK